MTDNEWIKTLPSLTNKGLLDTLDYCGYDSYYSKIREPVVAEIARRLEEKHKAEQADREKVQAIRMWINEAIHQGNRTVLVMAIKSILDNKE